MRVRMYGASDIGRVRKTNQDSIFLMLKKALRSLLMESVDVKAVK